MSAIVENHNSARRMARLAGLSYLIYTVCGLYITFGPIPSLSAFSPDEAPGQSLDFMFRTSFLAEVILYTFVCVSAAAMYVVLRSVSQGGAMIAAFCRLIESGMGATFIIFKYAAFAAMVNPDVTAGLGVEAGASLVTLLRDVYSSAIYVLLIPMAFGGVIFFSLFLQSRLIPRWLAGWGVVTCTVIGALAATILLSPELEHHDMFFFVPGALFEWVVAIWLLLAGIRTSAQEALPD